MRVIRSRRPALGDIPLRGAVLMPLCALVVHQLRFYVVYGSHTPAVLSREGHGYFSIVEPVVIVLAALALGWFAGRLARGRAGGARHCREATSRHASSYLRTWLACALFLFAIYCAQELLEGLFTPGHPAGIAGIVGHGGWTAAPISLLVGSALTLTLRVARWLLEAVERRPPRWAHAANASGHRAPRTADWRLDPRAGVVAGRGPPGALSPSLI